MPEDDITQWLLERGGHKNLNVELAKQLAVESKLGWYVAHHGHNRYVIGKATLQKLSSRHVVTDELGKALTFGSIEDAKTFLQDELKIFISHVFDY
jgi:hypothetical protein